MSGAALGWAKAQHAPSAVAKSVLICLADYADASGQAWPAIPKLASEVQVSDRTVQRALKALAEHGLIDVVPWTRDNGGQTSNRYQLTMTPGDIVSPAPRHSVTPPVTPVSPPIEPQSNQITSDEVIARPESDFDRFWSAYPAKVGKKAAVRAWAKAKDRPALAEMIAALERYRRSKPADRDWCNPATWLNEGRWMDGEPDGVDSIDPAASQAAQFEGPAQLRQAVVDAQGEPYARSYLDPARWDAASRTVFAANTFAASKLRHDFGDLARRWQFAIAEPAANDHAPRPTQEEAA